MEVNGQEAGDLFRLRGLEGRFIHHDAECLPFDDDTFDKLKQLARDRMATIQDLADEAFADLLKKHGIPIDAEFKNTMP